jgi:adenosylcobyric acid synthase
MAKSLMFVGTSSDSGKSVLAAAFCRILKRRGVRVAPFKAQNMALNSGVTPDGREMGRAQIVQAEAAGIEPDVDMNPILLKPTSEMGSQVIVHGRPEGNMDAASYYQNKKKFWPAVTGSYDRLAAQYDVIVLEGAGSPVEVNLKQNDIVNMAMAEYADASVVLVADIDRGGVFASIVGTVDLLDASEKQRLAGFIINKFRGDAGLLRDGLDFIRRKTGFPVLGVVPMLRDLYLPGEDSVALDRKRLHQPERASALSVGIIRLPHMANYTDFDPLELDPRISIEYVLSAKSLSGHDVIIIPGSKNVPYDMRFLRECGLSGAVLRYEQAGGRVIGICGGYQMLGRCIRDPHGVESKELSEVTGLGLLPITTIFEPDKITRQVNAVVILPGLRKPAALAGYEIHMGRSLLDEGGDCRVQDFLTAGPDGRVWGSYVHGLFDSDHMRDALIEWARGSRGGSAQTSFSYKQFKEYNYDLLADTVEKQVEVSTIFKHAGL